MVKIIRRRAEKVGNVQGVLQSEYGGMEMKMTKERLYKWMRRQTPWAENELLNPHNKDVADNEVRE